MIAYIGLGSNLNQPKQQIKNALLALEKADAIKITALSSLYQSPPFDGSKQPDYLNAVCRLNTHLSALELLKVCQQIELKQHRLREKKWAARTIDLDIILYADEIVVSKNLIIPHAQMMHRAFVLVPLFEIEPDLKVPILGKLQDLIDKIDTSKLQKL